MVIKKKRRLLPFFIFALLLNFFPISCINVLAVSDTVLSNIAPPNIASIEHEEAQYISRPLITGISQANTAVMIYIDGVYAGDALTTRINPNSESFRFYPGFELSAGPHSVFAIAKDPTSLRLSPPSLEFEVYIIPLPAPTLIQPNIQTVTSKVKHLITGLTVNNSRVHIYIDGRYNGTTANLADKSGTANFAYQPFLNLSVGRHTAWAVAEDALGRISGKSNILNFKIEEPYPAPTLLSARKGETELISGLAKNDSLIKVFVDKKLDGKFTVANDESGTANFAYTLKQKLSPGKHLIFATAVDSRGKESPWSNIIYNISGGGLEPAISSTAAEESAGQSSSAGANTGEPLSAQRLQDLITLARIYAVNKNVKFTSDDLSDLEIAIKNKDELKINTADLNILEQLLSAKKQELAEASKAVDNEAVNKETAGQETASTSSEIEDILKRSQATSTEETGIINESQENQSKLKLNLIIFIGFLLAVIAWIFWVNRELIKERREQNTDENEKPSGKDNGKLNI